MKHLLLILSLMIAGNAWCQTLTTQNGTTTLGGAALTGAAITNNYASGNAAIVLSNNVTVDATHTITAGGFIGTGGPGFLALSNAANTDYTVFVGAPSNSFNVPVIFRSTETNTSMGAGVIHSTSAGGRTSSAVVETDLTLADNTTANASTSAHGFVKKLPNDATKYYDGTGNYTVPAGGGGGTSVTNCFVIMTNAVLNNVNTNTSGAIQQLCALAWNHVAAVNGRAALDLMADQAGGTTFVRLNGKAVDTTVAVTIAMDYTNGFCAYLSNNATWYLTNSSSGAGNDAGIVSGTFQDATIGGSGTLITIAGPAGFTWTTSGSTATATTPSEVLTNGATQNIALGGGLTNNSAAGFNGNGAGVTNVWVKQVFTGRMTLNTLATGSQRFFPVDGTFTASQAAVTSVTSLAPVGGFLTNFQAWSSVAWPSTTNMAFVIQTNVGLSTPIATPVVCTLAPAGGSPYTNSGTTSLVLPSTQSTSGYVWALGATTTSSGGALAAQTLSWSIEWWHQ